MVLIETKLKIMKTETKRFICRILGHKSNGERSDLFEFEDGSISFTHHCKRCGQLLMSTNRSLYPDNPEPREYFATIEV